MTLTFVDVTGAVRRVTFAEYEYQNLMELLFDRCGIEWGDCKGRAWCGTCHIEVIKGELKQALSVEERFKLGELENVTEDSRLACQLLLESDLNEIRFRIKEE